MVLRRFWLAHAPPVAACVLAWLVSTAAQAQQFVVDGAAVTERGACRLEGWLSASAAWALPACTPPGQTELTLGYGRAGEAGERVSEFVAQAKVALVPDAPDAPGALGVAAVLGFGFGPFAQATGAPFSGLYAYAPLTYTSPGERLLVHANAGASYAREGRTVGALYGLRADLALGGPLTAIAEVFGEGPDVGAQAGARFALVPDRLGLDASYGVALRGGGGIGPAVGLAWTPAPFFRPLR